MSDAIPDVIRRFLRFVDDPLGAIDAGAETHDLDLVEPLERRLEELAFHAGRSECPPATEGVAVPELEAYDSVRVRVERAFPMLGPYNSPEFVRSRIGDSGCLVGDAVDDLVDIYRDLAEVEWLIKNAELEDAIWTLSWEYEHHWKAHLIGLQQFLWSFVHED